MARWQLPRVLCLNRPPLLLTLATPGVPSATRTHRANSIVAASYASPSAPYGHRWEKAGSSDLSPSLVPLSPTLRKEPRPATFSVSTAFCTELVRYSHHGSFDESFRSNVSYFQRMPVLATNIFRC